MTVLEENINKFLQEQGFKAIIQRLENNSFIKKNIGESVNIKEKTKEVSIIY